MQKNIQSCCYFAKQMCIKIKHIYWKGDYIVAFKANEVHGHGNGAVAVPVQSLDVVQQVGEKFVSAFQHAKGHDVVSPHFFHDLSGQPLRPEVKHKEDRQPPAFLPRSAEAHRSVWVGKQSRTDWGFLELERLTVSHSGGFKHFLGFASIDSSLALNILYFKDFK